MLCGAHQGILTLMREIEYATPMSKAMSAAASCSGSASQLFSRTAQILENGEGLTAGEAWRISLEQEQLNEADRVLLLLGGDGLGLSHSTEQLRSLELLRQRLAEAEKLAAKEADRCGRIWSVMGWSMGAVLALLLI